MPGAPFLASFAKCAKWGFDASPEVTRYNFSIITLPHPAAAFPVYLHVGPYVIHPHFFFEALSYVVAFTVYLRLRRRFGDSLATPLRWALVAAAVAGGALGAKILFWLEDPQLTAHSLDNPAYLVGGKTIVGALVFGLISVELTKRYIGLGDSTGDLYAIPLALGIAIGRIGCFLTGLSDNTYGTPTHLPWAVNFGDGIPRHPTQLYEIFFLLALIPILYRVLSKTSRENVRNKTVILSEAAASRSEADAQSTNPASPDATTAVAGNPYSKVCHFEGARANQTVSREIRFSSPFFSSALSRNQSWRPGDAFKLFIVAYLSFRLLCDFIKPYPRLLLGLGGIQWASVLILLYYSPDVARWLRPQGRIPAHS